jgi:hypothetical protein
VTLILGTVQPIIGRRSYEEDSECYRIGNRKRGSCRKPGKDSSEIPEQKTWHHWMEMASQCLIASDLRLQAKPIAGEKKYFEGFSKDWKVCKENGVVKGLDLVWGDGMEDVGKAWERLCKGEVGPSGGLVFTLNHGFTEKL